MVQELLAVREKKNVYVLVVGFYVHGSVFIFFLHDNSNVHDWIICDNSEIEWLIHMRMK